MPKNYCSNQIRASLGYVFTREGSDFFIGRMNEQCERGIVDEACDMHAETLGVSKKDIADNYWSCWMNWKPGNTRDLFIHSDQEVLRYFTGISEGQRFKGKGLYFYLAARDNFRCHYAGIPLMPIRSEIFSGVDKNIPQCYAWYPSIDHINSIDPDPIRHSLNNLSVVGNIVNSMFRHIDKGAMKKLMGSIGQDKRVDMETARLIGSESLKPSARVRKI